MAIAIIPDVELQETVGIGFRAGREAVGDARLPRSGRHLRSANAAAEDDRQQGGRGGEGEASWRAPGAILLTGGRTTADLDRRGDGFGHGQASRRFGLLLRAHAPAGPGPSKAAYRRPCRRVSRNACDPAQVLSPGQATMDHHTRTSGTGRTAALGGHAPHPMLVGFRSRSSSALSSLTWSTSQRAARSGRKAPFGSSPQASR